jgi:hypothetical protein
MWMQGCRVQQCGQVAAASAGGYRGSAVQFLPSKTERCVHLSMGSMGSRAQSPHPTLMPRAWTARATHWLYKSCSTGSRTAESVPLPLHGTLMGRAAQQRLAARHNYTTPSLSLLSC